MIGRYRPVQRYEPVKMSMAEYRAHLDKAAGRKAKRAERAKDLWTHQTPRNGRKSRRAQPRTADGALKPVLPTRKTVIAQLDHLFSLFIRRRDRVIYAGRCLICQKNPIDCCYHIIPKHEGYALRWEPMNAVGACSACNVGEFFNRRKYAEIHRALFPDSYPILEVAARQTVKYSTADLIERRDNLKAELEGRA